MVYYKITAKICNYKELMNNLMFLENGNKMFKSASMELLQQTRNKSGIFVSNETNRKSIEFIGVSKDKVTMEQNVIRYFELIDMLISIRVKVLNIEEITFRYFWSRLSSAECNGYIGSRNEIRDLLKLKPVVVLGQFDYEELKKMIDRTQKDLEAVKSMLVQNINLDDFEVAKKGDEGVIEFLQTHFSLEDVELAEEYYYTCLPLCLIDAIFSIGVTYTSTQNVVKRYCERYGLERIRKNNNEKEIHTLSDLIKNIEEYDISETRYERYASEVLCNTQRTSSVNGILKLQAVYECANILVENGINTIADFNEFYNDSIGKKYCNVKGQSSGISLSYLKMLCGSTDTIKPDRHILRFLNVFYEEEIDVENAKDKMESIVKRLNQNYKKLNMRELDYIIWDFMKNK